MENFENQMASAKFGKLTNVDAMDEIDSQQLTKQRKNTHTHNVILDPQ